MNRHILNHLMTIELTLIMLKENYATRSQKDIVNTLEKKRRELHKELEEEHNKAKIKFDKPVRKG